MIVGCCYMQPVHAQAAPVAAAGYNARLNVAIAGVVRAKLMRWGMAANDPRIAATIYGIQTGMTVLAGTAMAGGATISWPALLAAAGVAAVAGGVIKLAIDNDFKWTFNANGTVQGTGSISKAYDIPVRGTSGGPLTIGGNAGYVTVRMVDSDTLKESYYDIWGTNGSQLALAAAAAAFPGYGVSDSYPDGCNVPTPGYSKACTVQVGGYNRTMYVYGGYAPVSAASGYFDGRPPPPPTPVSVAYSSTKEAAEKIPETIKAAVAAPEAIAAAVNAVWKSAQNANDSGGIPWSASDPVTPTDVNEWGSVNPGLSPSVGDFSATANGTSNSPSISIGTSSSPSTGGSTGGGTSPGTSPGTGTGGGTSPAPSPQPEQPTTPVTPGEGEAINWGPNPNIGAPTLEETPKAAAILDPIFNIMPDLKSFAVPSHTAECPVTGFELYAKKYKIEAHCGLIEDNRTAIAACAVLCFSLAAMFIVLRA
ncbi:hypothetical protein [Pseudoduganella dura]|uniref:hypothetical protein n=1 Tax=Pseudoduganella dura TaxID=321982 RepID=UPI0016743CC8|nr:hypothetical protein [Pseudoduganella dura]GGY21278.1 hypothetical protein GCM10007386_57600 [Pseudoduganella dura]